MNFTQWTKSNADYGRKLVNSGFEGARSGREAFLGEDSLELFLSASIFHNAISAAVVGAGIGLLGAMSASRRRSASRAVACGVLGGAIGFGASVAWDSRSLGASVVSGAWKEIDKARDEHWLEKHPIDYA